MNFPVSPRERNRAALVVALYFFALLSGMAALIYEIAWTKMLAFTFGRTTLAASSVLGGFMAGMGIGAWLYHRAQGRRLDAIRLYASLEIGIAVTTALLTPALAALPEFFATFARGIPSGLGMNLFRTAFVLVILLVPAALMGATYPALCAVLIRSREGVGRHLGPIYGLNTVGAAAGALVAGFVLVEQLGLRGSVWTANCINLGVGVAAWLLSRSLVPDRSNLPKLEDAEAILPTQLPSRISGVVLFGSGFATLAYEIVWFRALGYLFGNSTYALTIMLVTFLLGLGLGGLLCGRTRQHSFPERSLALSQLGIAVLATVAIGAELAVLSNPDLHSMLSIFGKVSLLPWWQRLCLDLGLGLAMMLPATLLMGFSFPLASRLFLGDVRRLGERVGAAYLLANLGSILGAIAAALFILPLFGTIGGTRAIAVGNLLLGVLVLCYLRWSPRLRLAWGLGTAVAVFSTLLILPPRLPFRIPETVGRMRMQLLFEEEGELATVQVWASRKNPKQRLISVNGVPIGESKVIRPAMYAKQILLAHLPMVLNPEIGRTLNIGLGSASTLNDLASYPTVDLLDAVEISASVVRGSLLFEESRVLSDSRTRLFVEDIAHFLLQTPERYDLIISDGKLQRGFSGNELMLCRDFYEQAARRLSEEGIFIQWISVGYPHDTFKLILRTFLASFPKVELFFEDPGSVFLVGSRMPIGTQRADRFGSKRAGYQLSGLKIPSVEALLSRWVASGPELRRVTGEGRISTWDHSPISYEIYRSTEAQALEVRTKNLELLVRAHDLAEGNPFLPIDSRYAASSNLVRRVLLEASRGNLGEAIHLAEQAVSVNPDDPQAAFVLHWYRSQDPSQRARRKPGER